MPEANDLLHPAITIATTPPTSFSSSLTATMHNSANKRYSVDSLRCENGIRGVNGLPSLSSSVAFSQSCGGLPARRISTPLSSIPTKPSPLQKAVMSSDSFVKTHYTPIALPKLRSKCTSLGSMPPIHPSPLRMQRRQSAQDIMTQYGSQLNAVEYQELLLHPDIYYYHFRASMPSDDHHDHSSLRNGRYNIVVHDHLAYRYEITGLLGFGAFSDVVRATDHKTGVEVAIKIIRNMRECIMQSTIEVELLEYMARHDSHDRYNIVQMIDRFLFRGHVCIVFELLPGENLRQMIKHDNALDIGSIRLIAKEVSKTLAFMHKHRIIHCDIKPDNVMVDATTLAGTDGPVSSLKVIDFGYSCFESEQVHTRIQTRCYRAPEVVLGYEYSVAIDMWSLGCMLVECVTVKPLFVCPRDSDMLPLHIKLLGTPDSRVFHNEDLMLGFDEGKQGFVHRSHGMSSLVEGDGDAACVSLLQEEDPQPSQLRQMLEQEIQDEHLVDFVARCLTWHPDNRMTAAEALRHPFVLAADTTTPTTPPTDYYYCS